jgi:hypothetical protein
VTGGSVHVFYPEATDERCTAAVLLEIDPIGRIHEPVFAVLVLESEPIDPRL